MGLSRKMMLDGETVVLSVRTHVKALFLPFIWLVVVAALTGFLAATAGGPGDGWDDGWVRRGIVITGVVLIVWLSVLPFLRWLAWTYTITDKRLIEQRGLLTRSGRVIALNRITDVAYEKNLNDRIFGCGTLIIHDASEQSGLELDDVPGVASVHRTLSQLIFDSRNAPADESI